MHYVFCIIDPLYGVFGGIYYIDRVYTRASFTQTNPQLSVSDYFKWDSNIIFPLLMAFVHVAWLYFLLRYLEVRKYGGDTKDVVGCVKKKGPVSVVPETNDDVIEDEDEDVATERSRIINWNPAVDKAPVVMVKGLRKEFSKRIKNSGFCKKVPDTVKTKVAVRNSTFGVEGGEVFGLLGPNGAGKTTTMNMIIAEEGPTNGKVTVAGFDIRSSLSDAFQAMGYCPQHDPLWDVITTKEHISTYAIMRGIHPIDVKGITQFFLKSLRIEEHADKHAKKLSGGTKRKLCYALSMLGKPDVVLMDEPSTGMDPRSKRYLWDTISSCFRGTERGGILTTHYMEEADALCNRVAIMVNGQMECIGSTQRLKDRHGKGYVLEVKLQVVSNDSAELEDRVEGLDEFVQGVFPTSERMECFGERITYKLPQSDVTSLATAFSALEQGKMQFNIEEYSFSQSTLEQVFLEFAKRQKEEEIDDKDEELVKAEAAKERSNSARRRLNSQHSRTGYSNLGAEADDITAQVKKPAVSTYL
ncbi:unnamed protein product [Owenia fusiformis]|uniref:ABC transporter domain-containing protein n=1 Tax=Owenia fusiformis TaxID=6347 RepID=A0A8S4PQT9_OWEFU|nr:unnamed protein product [Owenia fusiformis]